MRTYRNYATQHGGSLVSVRPATTLFFKCHRSQHVEFPLSSLTLRNSSRWCPQCNPGSERPELTPSAPGGGAVRGSTRQRLEARLEEGKKHQATLLSSAKMLYKMTHSKSSNVFPSNQAPGWVARRIQIQVGLDLQEHPDVPEVQSKAVRALLACPDVDKLQQWNVVAEGLGIPASEDREKLYRKAAKLVHPDKCKHPKSNDAFKILCSIDK